MKNMKKIQNIRKISQILFFLLTIIGLINKFEITMTLIMVLTFIIGPIYCGFMCPLGFLQDLMSTLGRKMSIKKFKMPKYIQNYLVYVRYIVLFIVTVFSLNIIFTILRYDPRSNLLQLLLGRYLDIVSILIIVSFLLISLFFERPFCNYFCYEGAKYSLVGALKLFKITRNDENCISCKLCDKSCPMNITISEKSLVNSLQCIDCYECVSACPVENTLNLKTAVKEKHNKKKITLLVAILLVYLIVFVNHANLGEIVNANDLKSIMNSAEDIIKNELELDQRKHFGKGKFKNNTKEITSNVNKSDVNSNEAFKDDISNVNISNELPKTTTSEVDIPNELPKATTSEVDIPNELPKTDTKKVNISNETIKNR